MLEFLEIIESKPRIDSIGHGEMKVPIGYQLIFIDDELDEESIPELKEKLEEHFDSRDEDIIIDIPFDGLRDAYQIIMDIAFWYYKSQGEPDIPSKDIVLSKYKPILEEFYKENKPY